MQYLHVHVLYHGNKTIPCKAGVQRVMHFIIHVHTCTCTHIMLFVYVVQCQECQPIATLYIVPPCAVCSCCIVWLMCVILHMHVHVSVIAQDGYPPLIWAARYGHTEVVVELVKAKAKLDLQNIVMCTITKNTHTVV